MILSEFYHLCNITFIMSLAIGLGQIIINCCGFIEVQNTSNQCALQELTDEAPEINYGC